MPSSKRPSVSRSSVAASFASSAGWRKSLSKTRLPARSVRVTSAASSSAGTGAICAPKWSGASSTENPRSSAACAFAFHSARDAAARATTPKRNALSCPTGTPPLNTTHRTIRPPHTPPLPCPHPSFSPSPFLREPPLPPFLCGGSRSRVVVLVLVWWFSFSSPLPWAAAQLAAQRCRQPTHDQRHEHHCHQRVRRLRRPHQQAADHERRQHRDQQDRVAREEVVRRLHRPRDPAHPCTSAVIGRSSSPSDGALRGGAYGRSQRISAPVTTR